MCSLGRPAAVSVNGLACVQEIYRIRLLSIGSISSGFNDFQRLNLLLSYSQVSMRILCSEIVQTLNFPARFGDLNLQTLHEPASAMMMFLRRLMPKDVQFGNRCICSRFIGPMILLQKREAVEEKQMHTLPEAEQMQGRIFSREDYVCQVIIK